MSLIVETGRGTPNANSYVSVADAQSFVDARALNITITEALLLRAMDALDSVQWVGQKVHPDNALDWPRYGVVDRDLYAVDQDIVPKGIWHAQIWIAYYTLIGDDPALRAQIPVRAESVGPISTTFAIRAGERDQVTLNALPNVRNALRGYWRMGGQIDRA